MILSREQVREIDRRASAEYGIPSLLLMENAGRESANLILRVVPSQNRNFVVVCGPGNNGGDGFVIASHLHDHGYFVQTVFIDDPQTLSPDAAFNYEKYCREWAVFDAIGNHGFDVCFIDALFGTGLSRPLSERHAALVRTMNDSGMPIVAIDIPSGLDCDTGEPLGLCVKANHTATFVAPKLGFSNPASKQFTGVVHVLDIGIPPALLTGYQ